MDEELTLLLLDQMLVKLRTVRANYDILWDKVLEALKETDLLISDLEDRKKELEDKLCQKNLTTPK